MAQESHEKDTSTDASDDPRVWYAAERTLLAWIRTGLALMGFGFVVARFGLFLREIEAMSQGAPVQGGTGPSMWIGTGLVLLGVIVNVLISVEHLRLVRQVRFKPPHGGHSWWMGIAVAAALAILGTAMAIYLVFVER